MRLQEEQGRGIGARQEKQRSAGTWVEDGDGSEASGAYVRQQAGYGRSKPAEVESESNPYPGSPLTYCWFDFSYRANGSMDGSLCTNSRRGVLP